MSDDDGLRVTRSLVIPAGELEWRFSASGGPGGQHANRALTRVEVRFDARASQSLGPRQRERIVDRLGPVVTATASDSRSQARNRELAAERLRARLEAALRPPATRRATKPSRAAKRRRVVAKRRRSEVKRLRRRPRADD